MGNDIPSDGGLCFDAYHVDLRTGELRKHGRKIRLAGRPFQILALLLERPGELLTRKELQERLWSADTFVDFEHGVNAAIQTLRRALCDSHKNPRFIETLPRRGYRFIVAVEGAQVGAGPGAHLPRGAGSRLLPRQSQHRAQLDPNGWGRLPPFVTRQAATSCCSPRAKKSFTKCAPVKRPRTIWEFHFWWLLKNFC